MSTTPDTTTHPRRRSGFAVTVTLLLVAAAGPAGCSSGDSGPAPSSSARPAQVLADGPVVGAASGAGPLFTARPDGDGTVVSGVDRTTRAQVGQVRLDGRFRFPEVAPKAPVEGVSHDGRVVVVVTDTNARDTRFAVLESRLDRPARVITLPAGFSYDALSPDGSVLYLIEHLPPSGSEHYQVRAYDLAAGQLTAGAIADKSRVPEQMAGRPLARATSADGGWVATLYQRKDGEAFVHLLDARNQSALCLDLPRGSVTGWGLRYEGSRLSVHDAQGHPRFTEADGEFVPATG